MDGLCAAGIFLAELSESLQTDRHGKALGDRMAASGGAGSRGRLSDGSVSARTCVIANPVVHGQLHCYQIVVTVGLFPLVLQVVPGGLTTCPLDARVW